VEKQRQRGRIDVKGISSQDGTLERSNVFSTVGSNVSMSEIPSLWLFAVGSVT
jgi:hypothetical protein